MSAPGSAPPCSEVAPFFAPGLDFPPHLDGVFKAPRELLPRLSVVSQAGNLFEAEVDVHRQVHEHAAFFLHIILDFCRQLHQSLSL